MNERIQKFMEECFDISIDHRGREDCSTDYAGIAKFAKLIIGECLNICEEMGDNGKDGHYCADKIAKTFLR